MKKIAIVLAAIVLLSACREKTPLLVNTDLEGSWECVKGCEAEMLEFNISDGRQAFFLYSGQRMYRSGTWKLEKNRLTLAFYDEETLTYPLKLENDTLVMGDNEMVFTAYIPVEDPCDLSDFFALMDDISFSQPFLEDFSWNVAGEDDVEEVTVSGQMVMTIVKLEGDFSAIGSTIGNIAARLRDMDYESDPYNVTEIVSGYRKGSCVVLFRPETGDDDDVEAEVPLRIYFGKLP